MKPSSENCYRVSESNSYTLKFYNPFIMYKNYEYNEDLNYSITFKPVKATKNFEINETINKYNTNIRIFEGVNNKITIGENGQSSCILTPPKLDSNSIFLQMQICDEKNSIKTKILDVLTQKEILPEEQINQGEKNIYRNFTNHLMDTKLFAYGASGTKVFLRMVGINTPYNPSRQFFVRGSYQRQSPHRTTSTASTAGMSLIVSATTPDNVFVSSTLSV